MEPAPGKLIQDVVGDIHFKQIFNVEASHAILQDSISVFRVLELFP